MCFHPVLVGLGNPAGIGRGGRGGNAGRCTVGDAEGLGLSDGGGGVSSTEVALMEAGFEGWAEVAAGCPETMRWIKKAPPARATSETPTTINRWALKKRTHRP